MKRWETRWCSHSGNPASRSIEGILDGLPVVCRRHVWLENHRSHSAVLVFLVVVVSEVPLKPLSWRAGRGPVGKELVEDLLAFVRGELRVWVVLWSTRWPIGRRHHDGR